MEEIRIEKRFEYGILDRFDSKNATKSIDGRFEIIRTCGLCVNYTDCSYCPFKKLETSKYRGCVKWINKRIEVKVFKLTLEDISWSKINDKQARKQLKELRKKIVELIEFY